MNAFFTSPFNHCPLVWVFHNQTINNKINSLREMCLRIVYKDKKSSFAHLQMQLPEVVYVKRCLKNFAKFTGKHLCQSLFFNKVAGLNCLQVYWKRDSGTGVFLWIL